MSVSGKRGVGIPVILLHDAEGGIVTIELKNGYTYRGILDEAQDNMNCTMKECIRTDLAGIESKIDVAYIRGSQIKFVILPDMLQNAPFFNRIKMWRKFKGHAVFGSGLVAGPARGQSAAIIQKSQQRRMEVEGGGRGGGFGGRGDGGRGSGGFQGPGGPGGFQQGPQGGYQNQNQGGYQGQGPGGYQQQQQGGYGGPPPGQGGGYAGGMGGRGDFGGRGMGGRGDMGGRGGYQQGPPSHHQGGFQPPQGGPGQGPGGPPFGNSNGYNRPY